MSGFELNKIAASVLIAGLVMMVAGKIAGALYHPVTTPETRGYQVEIADEGAAGDGAGTASAEPIDLGLLLASASIERGQVIAKKCQACHDFEKGGPNKVGPSLWGVLGGKLGHVSNFAYSDALIAKGGGWDYDNLAEFVKNPKGYIKGTKMAFAGLRKPEDIADLLLFIRSKSDTQYPLPAPK